MPWILSLPFLSPPPDTTCPKIFHFQSSFPLIVLSYTFLNSSLVFLSRDFPSFLPFVRMFLFFISLQFKISMSLESFATAFFAIFSFFNLHHFFRWLLIFLLLSYHIHSSIPLWSSCHVISPQSFPSLWILRWIFLFHISPIFKISVSLESFTTACLAIFSLFNLLSLTSSFFIVVLSHSFFNSSLDFLFRDFPHPFPVNIKKDFPIPYLFPI